MKTQQESSYPHTAEARLITLVRMLKSDKSIMDDAVREFYACERVKRIARYVAREAGLDALVDEAIQLVADRFFTEGIIETIYDETRLYSLIYRVAENAIRQEAESNLRWHRKHEIPSEHGPGIEELHTIGDFSGDVLRKISRERSGTELMRRLEAKKGKNMGLFGSIAKLENDIARLAQETPPDLPDKVSRTAAKVYAPDVQELREIRRKLGYRIDDMARYLNISRDKMSAAIYGRLVPVPKAIMRDARDLLRASQAEITLREKKFSQFEDMNAVVKYWLEQLHLSDNRKGEDALAVILGVFHSTVFRWRKAAYKPGILDLVEYDKVIMEAVRTRKPAAAH
jgi:DNA-binding transcriptional regulator YiaG